MASRLCWRMNSDQEYVKLKIQEVRNSIAEEDHSVLEAEILVRSVISIG